MEYTTALFGVGLITFLLMFIEVNFTYASQGFAFGWSSDRDPGAVFSPLAQRIKNAYNNQIESTAYTVPVLAAAAIVGLESSSAETAAMILVIGRAIYGPLYYTGIPGARLVGFGMATLSTLFIAYKLLTFGLVPL